TPCVVSVCGRWCVVQPEPVCVTATVKASDAGVRLVPEIVATSLEGFDPVYGLPAASVTVTLPEAPAASVPIVHVTVPAPFTPPPVDDEYDQPDAIGLVIVTPVAVPEPMLA